MLLNQSDLCNGKKGSRVSKVLFVYSKRGGSSNANDNYCQEPCDKTDTTAAGGR